IIDGHIDIPYRLNKKWDDISVETVSGDFDFERARRGGLDAPFMALYVPARFQAFPGNSKAYALEMLALIERIVNADPDKFEIATKPMDLVRLKRLDKIAFPLGIENGSALESDIANVEFFYNKGVRYITLTHSEDNLICDSSYATTRTWKGLSPFGRQVVKEMNRLGVMIDISHVSDDAALQVLDLTTAPVIASHSSLRHFTPGWERNMSDEVLLKLAENDGVIMINFGSNFLIKKALESRKVINQQVADYVANLEQDIVDQGEDVVNQYKEKHRKTLWKEKYKFAKVQHVADHIDYAVKLVGIDHVGLGSDFDGVGDSLPDGLKDASGYPNLIYELLQRGYSKKDIKQICSENLLRVWKAVQK
ncbi:peptidase M19, partial [Candidatus Marinamargulisbacteria bacterium SCGC AG-414-C22]